MTVPDDVLAGPGSSAACETGSLSPTAALGPATGGPLPRETRGVPEGHRVDRCTGDVRRIRAYRSLHARPLRPRVASPRSAPRPSSAPVEESRISGPNVLVPASTWSVRGARAVRRFAAWRRGRHVLRTASRTRARGRLAPPPHRSHGRQRAAWSSPCAGSHGDGQTAPSPRAARRRQREPRGSRRSVGHVDSTRPAVHVTPARAGEPRSTTRCAVHRCAAESVSPDVGSASPISYVPTHVRHLGVKHRDAGHAGPRGRYIRSLRGSNRRRSPISTRTARAGVCARFLRSRTGPPTPNRSRFRVDDGSPQRASFRGASSALELRQRHRHHDIADRGEDDVITRRCETRDCTISLRLMRPSSVSQADWGLPKGPCGVVTPCSSATFRTTASYAGAACRKVRS